MREIPLPKFHEGLLKEGWYQTDMDQKLRKAAGHPFCQNFMREGMREGIFSDMAGALGKIHDVVVEAAKPNLIARQIIDTRSTTEALERFVKAKTSVAYVGAEGGLARISGERYETVDIQTNIILKDAVEWNREFAEDAKWNVMSRELEELGRSVAEKETAAIIALYGAVAAADLAGGAVIAGGGLVLSWSKLVEMWDAVKGENFRPDVIFMHTKQSSQLLTATEFINQQYMPSAGLDSNGQVGQVLKMSLFDSSKCTNGIIFAASKNPAGVLLIRRDITTEPWENPQTGKVGVVASERVGYGILRTKAISSGTNFKTTF
jgi:HK97 family phage major capsid protein